MFYTVYKITNLINNKIYIGTHKTNDLNDDYMGSGINIKRAIKKYGSVNFNKEYLAVFDNPDDMYTMESTLVSGRLLDNDNTYNIAKGGNGGWDYVNKTMDKNIRHQIAVMAGKSVPPEKQGIKVPAEVRKRVGRYMGTNFGGSNRFTKEEINSRLSAIKHIDLTKYGWVVLVAKIWGVSSTQVKRFFDKYYLGDFYRRNNV